MDKKNGTEVSGLMAVWRYDNPPYYLADEIVEVCDDGRVKPKRYGGMTFRPVAILPYDEKRIKLLESLAEKYHADCRKLCDDTKAAAEKIFDI